MAGRPLRLGSIWGIFLCWRHGKDFQIRLRHGEIQLLTLALGGDQNVDRPLGGAEKCQLHFFVFVHRGHPSMYILDRNNLKVNRTI